VGTPAPPQQQDGSRLHVSKWELEGIYKLCAKLDFGHFWIAGGRGFF
jgi:hypothetical protein